MFKWLKKLFEKDPFDITQYFASKRKQDARRKICVPCIANTGSVDKKLGRCLDCGCFLNAKITLRGADCPKKLW